VEGRGVESGLASAEVDSMEEGGGLMNVEGEGEGFDRIGAGL